MEADILLWIQDNLRNDFLTPLMKGITMLGNAGWIWIVFSLLLLLKKEYRKAGLAGSTALCGSFLVNNIILKNLVGRIRPYEVIDGLQLLVNKAWDASFPSGHAGASFATATAFFCMLPRRYGIPALLLAACISFSRLYVGMHYPTDVLVGMLDGILLGLFSAFLVRKQRIVP